MDRSWYDNEVKRQLADTNTYRPVSLSDIPTKAIYDSIVELARKANLSNLISGQAYLFLRDKVTPKTAVIPQLYIIPKVHKQPLKGRPIIPGHSWITTPASILIDHFLQPLLRRTPTVLADSKSLLIDLNTKTFPDTTCRLITADVSSLYTEIDLNKGLAFVKALMRENPDLYPPALQSLLSDFLSLVMRNNFFHFNGEYYHQIKGTAMGTPSAPIFANVFMFILERHILGRFKDSIFYYKRYLDDIFIVTNADAAERIKSSMQVMERHIKLEFQDSLSTATFLDLVFFKGPRYEKERILDSKVYQKPLNAYLYIPFSSYHTLNTKKGFIVTELQRYVRNSTSLKDYLEVKEAFWFRLRTRGYPPAFLTQAFSKVWFRDRNKFLAPSIRKPRDERDVFFTTEYNPLSSALSLTSLVKQGAPGHLKPRIGYKSSSNLSNILCQNKSMQGVPSTPRP